VTSMNEMFRGCTNLTSVDVSGFNTGNVTYMEYMFSGCTNLTNLDLSNFDLSSLKEAMDFLTTSSESALTSIYTPRNCPIYISLPKNPNESWRDGNGKEYLNLPQNREDSILLLRGDHTVEIVEKIIVHKSKTVYGCGDTINTDDLDVMYYAKDGTVKKVSDYTTNASKIDMTTPGDKTLTITYIPENGSEAQALKVDVKLTVTNANVKISGIYINNSIYSKTPVIYRGTAKVISKTNNKDLTNEVTLTYTYSGIQEDGSLYAESQTAPINAGSYKLTVAVVAQEGQNYAGSAEYPFHITKAPITLTARSMELKIGADLPKAEDYQYDLTGLLEGDSLLKVGHADVLRTGGDADTLAVDDQQGDGLLGDPYLKFFCSISCHIVSSSCFILCRRWRLTTQWHICIGKAIHQSQRKIGLSD